MPETNVETIQAMLEDALYAAQEDGGLSADAQVSNLQDSGWLTNDQGIELKVDGHVFLLRIQQVR